MVLEDPSKREKKRFEELQKQGYLPGAALKKIEAERRLGIIPEEKSGIENWWFYGTLGAIGVGILYVYVRSRV